MNILVLSPHTDDCELGCGGSLTKWSAEGHNIFVVVFSLCEESIPDGFDKQSTRWEFNKNMFELGLIYGNTYIIREYKVRQFPQVRQEILDELIIIKKDINPDLVVGTSLNDIHQDHKTIAEEMQRAFRCSIISYELPYTTLNFRPTYYVPLERKHIENKISLLSNYKSQIAKGKGYIDPEFNYGLAKVRGAQIDKEYAESFEVIRWIQ